ncbi:unnamed protein product, partial [Amoebophrya sp. A25]
MALGPGKPQFQVTVPSAMSTLVEHRSNESLTDLLWQCYNAGAKADLLFALAMSELGMRFPGLVSLDQIYDVV